MQFFGRGLLGGLRSALGLEGAEAPRTSFDDGLVSQVLDVAQTVAFAKPFTTDRGMVLLQFNNVHAVANTQNSDIDPYGGADTYLNGALEQVEALIAHELDLWLHHAAVGTIANGANATSAAFEARVSSKTPQITDGATGSVDYDLASWNAFTADYPDFPTAERLDFRLPETWDGIRFTSVSSGAWTVYGWILAEFVPRGFRPSGF